MSESRPAGLGMTTVVGGILLLSLLVGAAFIPVLECVRCGGGGQVMWEKLNSRREMLDFRLAPCEECNARGKVSLLKRFARTRKATTVR